MKPYNLLLVAAMAMLTPSCVESLDVTDEGIKGFRFGTDTAALHYKNDKFEYSVIKNNNSKSFKEGASLAKHTVTGWGLVEAGKQATAQVVSDNSLKAKQATEETTRQANILNGTKFYMPAEQAPYNPLAP
jgi:hypothetical protein